MCSLFLSGIFSETSCGLLLDLNLKCQLIESNLLLLQYGAGVTRDLDCPKEMVGRVIGKGGETIKAMQREFQANIQIDQTSLPMKITISGQPASVERAYGVVAEIVAGGNPYIGGSVGHAGKGLGVMCSCSVHVQATAAKSVLISLFKRILDCFSKIRTTYVVFKSDVLVQLAGPHCNITSCLCLILSIVLQCKELPEVQHQELHLVMVPPPHMVPPHSMPQPSLHTVATQAIPQQLQPPHTQAMVVAILRPAPTAATHRFQQLPMVVRHPMVEQVVQVVMILMVHRVSRHMAVLAAMVSRVLSLVHSRQQQAAVVSGKNSKTMRAGHISTIRSPASANGTAQLTCKQLAAPAAAALVAFSSILTCQHRSGKTECSCAWSV